MNTFPKGDRVLHRLHPEWGVGVVLRKQKIGIKVRFENSHYTDDGGWADEWICAPGHLETVGDMSETQIHDLQEQCKLILKIRKVKEEKTV